MTPEQLGYIAIAAALIGLVVRLLKQDVAFLPTVPSKYRPAVALALGLVAGVLEAASQGTPWKQAILNGLLAAGTAIVGHGVLIDGLRGGRELGQPKLVSPDDAPTSPVLPKDPPSVPTILLFILGALFIHHGIVGCSSTQKAAAYTKDLAECEATSTTCDEYVACRSAAAAAQGRKFTGYCVKDGGAE
jgi:hypothetical protein